MNKNTRVPYRTNSSVKTWILSGVHGAICGNGVGHQFLAGILGVSDSQTAHKGLK